jgi:hypothetical protein
VKVTDAERIDRLERALSATLTWLTLSLGKNEAIRIKAILEADEQERAEFKQTEF